MSRTRIKICGITREQDAIAAAEAGADAIGLVFYEKSPRAVDIDAAYRICKVLPAFVSVVALCVDKPAADVRSLLNQLPIDLLQFHGEESPEFCAQFEQPFLKALRMKPGLDVIAQMNCYSAAQGILLDTYRKGVPGGTGEQFNWEEIPIQVRSNIVLAGGLSAENVQNAIRCVQPYAVDVSGGVEASPGVKDENKIRHFVEQVALANNQ